MTNQNHKTDQAKARFFVSSPGDGWSEIKASTLRGAKRAALNIYQVSNGGMIRIGEFNRNTREIETVSIKEGYNNWSDNK